MKYAQMHTRGGGGDNLETSWGSTYQRAPVLHILQTSGLGDRNAPGIQTDAEAHGGA